MPMDGFVFTAVAQHLQSRIVNARVQGVYQPRPQLLYLRLRQPGATMTLACSIDPQNPSIHWAAAELPNPQSLPPFASLLRKHLIPGRILSVDQPPWERVLSIAVEGRDARGSRCVRVLVIEMIGRLSNVILKMKDTGTIIDTMRRTPDAGRGRVLLPRRPYEPPPMPDQENPSHMNSHAFDQLLRLAPPDQRLDRYLTQHLMGLGPFAAREIIVRAGLPSKATTDDLSDAVAREQLWTELQKLVRRTMHQQTEPSALFSAEGAEFWLFPMKTRSGEQRTYDSVLHMMDEVYDEVHRRQSTGAIRRRLMRSLTRHRHRVEKKATLQSDAVQTAKDADQYRRNGDLILAHIGQIRPGSSSVTLPDIFVDGQPITIALDPEISPADNAQRWYKRYHRAKKTVRMAGRQLAASRAEAEYIASIIFAVEASDTEEQLRQIEEEMITSGYIAPEQSRSRSRRAAAKNQKEDWLTFRSSDDMNIWVGRNNRQNDLLTMKKAKPSDMWLHAQKIPGAHVIVELEDSEVMPERTLREAAKLAAYFSQAKDSNHIPVDYTRRRYVRKPKNARPGMVTYERHKTIYVTPDDDSSTAMSRR